MLGMEDASAYDGYRDLMVNVLYTGSVNPTKPSVRRRSPQSGFPSLALHRRSFHVGEWHVQHTLVDTHAIPHPQSAWQGSGFSNLLF